MEESFRNWINEKTLLPNNATYVEKFFERMFAPIGLERRARDIIAKSLTKETSHYNVKDLQKLSKLCDEVEKEKDSLRKIEVQDTVTKEIFFQEVFVETKNEDNVFTAKETDKEGNIISEAIAVRDNKGFVSSCELSLNNKSFKIKSTKLPLTTKFVFTFILRNILNHS